MRKVGYKRPVMKTLFTTSLALWVLGSTNIPTSAFAHEECEEGPQVVAALTQGTSQDPIDKNYNPEDYVCTDTAVSGKRFVSTIVVLMEGYIYKSILHVEGKIQGAAPKADEDSKQTFQITRISRISDWTGHLNLFPTENGQNAVSVRALPDARKALVIYKNSRVALLDFSVRKSPTMKEIVNLSNSDLRRSGEIPELHWRDLKDGLEIQASKKVFTLSVRDENAIQKVCEIKTLTEDEQKGICDTVATYGSMLAPDVLKRYKAACETGRLERCSDENPIRRISFAF